MRSPQIALAAVLIAAVALPAQAGTPAPAERDAEFAKLPYWPGLWIPLDDETAISGIPQAYAKARQNGGKPPEGFVRLNGPGAPWNAEGKQRMADLHKLGGNRTADGWGFPMIMNAAAPIQFFITPEKVMIINGYRDVTDVRINQQHPSEDDLWPTVWGDSVGHWEGDTLVIDTIEVKNPNHYFHGAPPLSEKAHYVQRIRMTAPDRLVDDITITDPVTLSEPWVSHLTFMPAEGFDRIVYDNFDNDRTDSAGGTIKPPQDELPAGADKESYHQ